MRNLKTINTNSHSTLTISRTKDGSLNEETKSEQKKKEVVEIKRQKCQSQLTREKQLKSQSQSELFQNIFKNQKKKIKTLYLKEPKFIDNLTRAESPIGQ